MEEKEIRTMPRVWPELLEEWRFHELNVTIMSVILATVSLKISSIKTLICNAVRNRVVSGIQCSSTIPTQVSPSLHYYVQVPSPLPVHPFGRHIIDLFHIARSSKT